MTDKPYRLWDVRNGSAWVTDPLQYITRGCVRRNGSIWVACVYDYSDSRTVTEQLRSPKSLTVDPHLTDDELRSRYPELLKAQGMGRAMDCIKDFTANCGSGSVQLIFRTRDDAATWVVLNN